MFCTFNAHVIFYRNSDFFSTLFKENNSEFQERRSQRLLIPEVMDATISALVDIMYGKDFNSESLLVIKELILIGGVYDPEVQDVASEKLKDHLDSYNVMETLKYCKTHKARSGAIKCMEFLLQNFHSEITSVILDNMSFQFDEL